MFLAARKCRAATARDAVGEHVTHRCLAFFQRDLGVSLGGESEGVVLVAKALQDKIQDTRLCGTLTDVLEFIPLLKYLGNIFIRVLVWHHDHAVQFAHQNTPSLH